MRDAGVVHQHVEAAEGLGGQLGEPAGAVTLREIDCSGVYLGAEFGSQGALGVGQLALVAAAEHHLRAGRCEGPCHVGANALGGTGDQRALTVQSQCARITGFRHRRHEAPFAGSSSFFTVARMAVAVAGSVTNWLK